MTTPETASFKEFAGIAGFRPSYIAQLKADDRLVLTDDGKRVRVAESLRRIEDTKDPSKSGVSARHAAERESAAGGGAGSGVGPRAPAQGQDGAEKTATTSYQTSRAVKERFLALEAKRAYEQAIGKLLDASEVASAASNAATILRQRLEVLPDVLASQVVQIDEARARAIIAEAIDHALSECERQLSNIAKAA